MKTLNLSENRGIFGGFREILEARNFIPEGLIDIAKMVCLLKGQS